MSTQKIVQTLTIDGFTTDGEQWACIPDYPKYFVSNQGRVYTTFEKRILEGEYSDKGYHFVRLYNDKYRNGKKIKVSHLVAMVFCDRFKKGMEVHHINCDNADDRAVNLLPVTKLEHIIIHVLYRHIIKYPHLVVELFKRKKPNIKVTINFDTDNDIKGGDAA